MNAEQIYDFFVISLFPPVVFMIGLLGYITPLIVFKRKQLKAIGPILVYNLLFITDASYLIIIIVTYLQTNSNFDPTIRSRFGCKVFSFFDYALGEISPWLLVYISIEKCISIAFSSNRKVMRRILIQMLFFIGLIMIILIGNVDEAFFYELATYNLSNTTYLSCTITNNEFQNISTIIFFIIQALLPFILMILFSIMLIVTIFNSRSRNQVASSVNENNRLKRDVKFALSSLSMNVLFAILNSIFRIRLPSIFLVYFHQHHIY